MTEVLPCQNAMRGSELNTKYVLINTCSKPGPALRLPEFLPLNYHYITAVTEVTGNSEFPDEESATIPSNTPLAKMSPVM